MIAILLVAAGVWLGAMAVLGPELGPVGTIIAQPVGPATPRSGLAATPTPTVRRVVPAVVAVPGEVLLTRLTEDELTEALRRGLAAQPEGAMLESPRVQVTGERLLVTGVLRGLPLPVDMTATARVEVRNGRPVVVVERVEGSGFSLPDSVRQDLNALVDRMILVPERTDVEVTRVELDEGEVSVYGRRR